jgi:predicted HTH transcriptional regulator
MPDLQVGLRYKPFNQIVYEDLLFLIRNEVSEKQTLEYKKVLPHPKSNKDKLEFLKDISSFVNSKGGYLIYGIEAINEIPKNFEAFSLSIARKFSRIRGSAFVI